MNDKELIEAIISGNQTAFRQFVDKYQVLVFTTCIGFVGNKESAQDLSQDVFVEAFKSIHKFRGQSKLSTWLYRISVNKSLNYIRDQKKHNIVKSIERFFYGEREEQLEIEDKSMGYADLPIEQNEHSQRLHDAINSLPQNQQIAFTLHKFDDLSYKDISEVMDLSLSSVESLIHRAKVNLKKKLFNYYKENF